MGFYIQVPENKNKAVQLCEMYGAEPTQPQLPALVPEDKVQVCVVVNPLFDAAALCYNQREFEDFTDPSDMRARTWLLMDKTLAYRLAGFDPIKSAHLLD